MNKAEITDWIVFLAVIFITLCVGFFFVAIGISMIYRAVHGVL